METILFAVPSDNYGTEPMNIGGLSALAKDKGRPFKTDIAVLRDKEGRPLDIVQTILEKKPAIVAFSAITGSHHAVIEANRKIKDAVPGIKTIIGGPYATFRPNLIREEPFDAIAIGEADEAWPELLDEWAAGRSGDVVRNILTQGNHSQVLKFRVGLADDASSRREREKLESRGASWQMDPAHLRDRFTDLDSLPFMDRELILGKTAFRHHSKRSIMAGRGCPFRCTYCFEHKWNEMYTNEDGKLKGKVLQRYSVRRLCDELVQLKKDWPNTVFIKFYDDVFPCFGKEDLAWLEEFAELYPKLVGLPFHALVRADLVDEPGTPALRALKKSGIASLTMSIEGGNQFSRDHVLIRDMTDANLRNAFKACREQRINTFANTILAVPVPTLPDVKASELDYRKQLDRVLKVVSVVDPKRKKRAVEIKKLIADAQASAPEGGPAQRKAVDRALRGIHVRERNIDYDLESLWYNVRIGVSFGEFPVFFPYDGTQLGVWSLDLEAFDGDYDKLHESYQTASPLDCFDEREKLWQQNLALLGTVVLTWSGSYNPLIRSMAWPFMWTVPLLMRFPLTGLYTILYSVTKTYMHRTRVYPSPRSVRDTFRVLRAQLTLDKLKHLGARKKAAKLPPMKRDERPGQTLGGSSAP